MVNTDIILHNVEDVKHFVNIVNEHRYSVDLVSGRYKVNAKSIMGIFSLDLSKPIKMEVAEDQCDELLRDLNSFMAIPQC